MKHVTGGKRRARKVQLTLAAIVPSARTHSSSSSITSFLPCAGRYGESCFSNVPESSSCSFLHFLSSDPEHQSRHFMHREKKKVTAFDFRAVGSSVLLGRGGAEDDPGSEDQLRPNGRLILRMQGKGKGWRLFLSWNQWRSPRSRYCSVGQTLRSLQQK